MKKGLYTALCVGALAFTGLGSVHAAAPVILNMPDVTVGDLDDPNCVGTGANFFVYTNAFSFDSFVTDSDTPLANLLWSFDEADDPVAPNERWYEINGKQAVLLGNTAIANDQTNNYAAHVNPGANELRSVSATASFRDIVLSPLSGPPFNPTPTQLAEHATGKVLRFYASDTINVATKEIIVRSVDNVCDTASGGSQLGCQAQDTLTTSANWVLYVKDPSAADASYSGLSSVDHDVVNGALRARILADPGTAGTGTTPVNGSIGLFRAAGWRTIDTYSVATLPYASIGTGNVVRSKWFVYTTGSVPALVNSIPQTRLQLYIRTVIASTLEVFTHKNDGTVGVSGDELGSDVRPSTNPALPSLYRCDFDPIDVPYLVLNGATEGINRAFIAQSEQTQDNGYIAVTEVVTGCYPKSLAAGTLLQTFQPSASDAGGLKTTGVTPAGGVGGPSRTAYSYPILSLSGRIPVVDFSAAPTIADSSAGVTMDSTAYNGLPSGGFDTRIGILLAGFYPGDSFAARARVEPGKQYRIRYHIVGTRQTNRQAGLRMQAVAGNFTYAQKLEISGATAGGAQAQSILAQAQPGVGSQNPDKIGAENGGYYDLLMYTPLSKNVRPENASLTVAQRFPSWFLFAGYGVNDTGVVYGDGLGTPAGLNRRDLRLFAALLDTLTFSVNAVNESSNYTIDKIEVFAANAVDDGTPE